VHVREEKLVAARQQREKNLRAADEKKFAPVRGLDDLRGVGEAADAGGRSIAVSIMGQLGH